MPRPAAQLKLAELQRAAELPRTAEPLLSDLITSYGLTLKHRVSPLHFKNTQFVLVKYLQPYSYPSEINPQAIHSAVCADVRPQTAKVYVQHIKSFCNWLTQCGTIEHSPFVRAKLRYGRTERVILRRVLSREESQRLIDTARVSGLMVREMSGIQRSILYSTALGTGFRVKELRSLKKRNIDFDTAKIIISGMKTKNSKDAVQPISRQLLKLLSEYTKEMADDEWLWPQNCMRKNINDILRVDLKAAGIPFAVMGPHGRAVVNFHAFRHTFITRVVEGGANPNEAMKLARHSSVVLTLQYYTHSDEVKIRNLLEEI